MEPTSRSFRGDIAFAQRQKLNHVTRTVRNLSPKREETTTRHGRQAIDPRWDPYSGEITSSDKGKPQSVKPKTFGVSLRSVAERTERNGNLKTPTPVGERIRRLNKQTSSETLEIKSPMAMSTSSNTSISKFEMSHEDLPSSKESESNTSVQSPPEITPSKPESLGGKFQLDNSEASDEAAEPNEVQSTSHLTARSMHEQVVKSDIECDNVRAENNEETSAIQPERLSLRSVSAEVKQQHVESHLDTGFKQTNPLLDTSPEFQKKFPDSSPPINPTNTDHVVQPQGPNHTDAITSSEASLVSRSSNDTWDETLIKRNDLAERQLVDMNVMSPREKTSSPHHITRKAVPPNSPIFISMSAPIINSSDPYLNAKNLPQTPAENSSDDLVTALQAHLDSLAHRRRNITRSIRQMTELMPRDNLLITDEVRLKREHEKRKIAILREEEAEIKREEYEIGLRLHRAWKRSESGAVYEPTSLWVRRVTGVGKNWCWPHQDLPVF